ncbi:MAG: hydrogenase maturation protease [Acidobacteriota bacterium]|nr:MAG: hydrogenase maturation protease [Acidobacteriota bacterium]
MKTLVIGLGNPLLCDDGVGWHVTRELRPLVEQREDVDVVDLCVGGLRLMEQMIGYDRVIIIDAMRTGARPGTVRCLTADAIPTQHSASAHDVNLPTALELGHRLGADLPGRQNILLVAIEAADVETFAEHCTPSVAAAVPQAVAAVGSALEREGTLS